MGYGMAAAFKCLGMLPADLLPLSRKYPLILALLLDRGLSALVSTGKRAMRPALVYE